MQTHYKEKLLPIKFWLPIRPKRYLEKLRYEDNYLFKLYGISIKNNEYVLDSIALNKLVKELKHLSNDKKRRLKVALKERLNECSPNYPLGIQTFNWTLIIGGISTLSLVFALLYNNSSDPIKPFSSLGVVIFCFLFLTVLMCIASTTTTRRLDAYKIHCNYLQRVYDILEIYNLCDSNYPLKKTNNNP